MSYSLRRFIGVGVGTAAVSALLSLAGRGAMSELGPWSGVVALVVIMGLGVVFDVVGVAATAAGEGAFHAMAADRVRGATQAIWIVRHADRVANFANDMVGDAAGTLSGAIGATLVAQAIQEGWPLGEVAATTLVVAVISGVTVGGKAAVKAFAIGHAEGIVAFIGRLAAWLESVTGAPVMRGGPVPRSRRKGWRSGRNAAERPRTARP